jgi:cellulose biosynthesis protein BcsQ
VIVSFYSYKGGTGRTMALANIAVLLATAGRRVLVVDFDLEAPGIWRYYADFQRNLESRPGLVDMLLAHIQLSGSSTVDWRDYITTVRVGTEAIDLMTSGKLDSEYPARVLEFDWDVFFQNYNGGRFFEDLRKEWKKEYDFVLIDSRTGITDIGGICTIALPDMIVSVFVANNQNIDGTVDVLRRAQRGRQQLAYDRPPALVLPLLSRFDNRTELELVNEWLSTASNRLGEFYSDWLPRGMDPRFALERTKLPYIAYFGFGEKLAVLLQGVSDPDSLGYALNAIAKLIDSHLTDVSPVSPEVTGQPTDRPPAVTLAPPSDSWIAAVHSHGRLIGSAFLLDRERLLTAAHVVREHERGEDEITGLTVSFPKSADKSAHQVARVTVADQPELDAAVIHLTKPVSSAVGVPRLRFASPADLTGRPWWAFGYPYDDPLGSSANGTVGAALAYGSVRLDTESRYRLEPGFSGAPVWSPNHTAVVALLSRQNERGDGIALTLAEIDHAVPEERLRGLSGSVTDLGLDRQQRKLLIDALEAVFYHEAAARSLLEDLNFPSDRISRWDSFASPELYWTNVLTELENGIVEGGVRSLVRAAAARYPGNSAFQQIAELQS